MRHSGPCRRALPPVSYTHLDVYKRQDQKLADVYAVQDGGATDTQFGAKEFTGTVTASESLDGATQSRVDVAVSYTHLDVYKRQILPMASLYAASSASV